jgi:hypothetical protein
MSQQSQGTVAGPATRIYAAILDMDQDELDAFRSRLRKRYTRDDLVAELQACALRMEKSPTMREFAEDPAATVHPQTLVDHFGSWNEAKRAAGLVPRRNATREELLAGLRMLGRRLERTPLPADLDEAQGLLPGRSVYVRAFGSVNDALIEAGFDLPTRDERLERTIEHGAQFLLRTGRLPSFRDWERVRGGRDDLLSAWQVYRAFEACGGAWSAFQFAVDERSRELRQVAHVA